MPSFDIVSELDMHEVNNALDQANREVGNRYDFKGVEATFTLKDGNVALKAEADFQLQQMLDILMQKLAKRGVDLKHLKAEDPVVFHKNATQTVKLQQGIATDIAKNIVKKIKSEKLKVQAAIQGEQVRVTGKKRDDLQNVISMLRDANLDVPLQYVNFRD